LKDPFGQFGDGVDEVLAVVENEQDLSSAEALNQAFRDRLPGLRADAEDGGDRVAVAAASPMGASSTSHAPP
jgi:hypothetical protein